MAAGHLRSRTGKLLQLLSIAAASLLLGGSWFFLGRSPEPQRIALRQAAGGAGEHVTAAVERLRSRYRALIAAAAEIVWEKAPQLGDLLGLAEPPAQVRTPPSVRPELSPQRRVKTEEELRAERLIEATFQEYFREYTIRGKRLTVRMPFALNGEREDGRGYFQDFYFDGKGTPAKLWPYIDSVLRSRAFQKYAAQLASPGEKVVAFTLQRRAYQVSSSPLLLESLQQDSYPGTPTRILVRRSGGGVSEADVYNYLYAVSAVGVDCSGLSYHVLESLARSQGLELDRLLGRSLGVSPREVRKRVGLWFYDPAHGYTERVTDRIEQLRPGDLILFRGRDGAFKHSAVIQSIDLENGVIRYLQSTDWASEEERGVHLSTIRFDPARAGEDLAHYSVRWLHQVRPPFAGEKEPRNWQTDRDRYLWYTEAGGSMVVRLRLLASAFLTTEPRFYTALGPPEAPTASGRPAPP